MALFPFQRKPSEEDDLAAIPLFAELGPHELKIVRKVLILLEFKKGDFIYRQGDAPEAFYILHSGRLRAFLQTREGHEKTVAYFYRGDYFGEVSILTDKPHSVSVEARNDALIYKIDKEDFKQLLK